MNNLNLAAPLDHCGDHTAKLIVNGPAPPKDPPDPRTKCCKVVLEDVSYRCVAAKPKTLNASPDNNHSTHSRHIKERDILDNMERKRPIA